MGLGWFSDSCALGRNFLVVHMYGERKRRRHTHIYIYIYIQVCRHVHIYVYVWRISCICSFIHEGMLSFLSCSLIGRWFFHSFIDSLFGWLMHAFMHWFVNELHWQTWYQVNHLSITWNQFIPQNCLTENCFDVCQVGFWFVTYVMGGRVGIRETHFCVRLC